MFYLAGLRVTATETSFNLLGPELSPVPDSVVLFIYRDPLRSTLDRLQGRVALSRKQDTDVKEKENTILIYTFR